MDDPIKQEVQRLKADIAKWEDFESFFEDSRIMILPNVGGTAKSGEQVAKMYRKRVEEYKELIAHLESSLKP